MSIASEITRIQNAKDAIKTSIENKGGSCSGTIDTYASAIDALPSGGGDEDLVKDLIERTSGATITIPNYVTKIGNCAFQSWENLQSVTIGDSILSIGSRAFMSCLSIKSIKIGNGCVSLGQDAIYNSSSLLSIDIGTGLKSMTIYSIEGNKSLTTIICRATTPPSINSNSIASNTALVHIYVPSSSVDAYKSATNWSNFADIISAIEE